MKTVILDIETVKALIAGTKAYTGNSHLSQASYDRYGAAVKAATDAVEGVESCAV